MYSKSRVEPQECFAVIREKIERMLPPDMPMVVALDDTLRQKSGTGIHGVAWRRDPLGPKFQVNLVLAQRFIQLSAALAAEDGSARMIPIDLTHAPSARKPGAKATAAQIQCYKESKNQLKLNRQATERVGVLRDSMDAERELMIVADGSYTNGDFLKALPDRTTMIGRHPQGRHSLQNARAGAQNRTPTKLRARDSHARTDSQGPRSAVGICGGLRGG